MIILIGGVSCTGKTFMAQKLLEKYKIPYTSIDHIKMGLFRGGIDIGFTMDDSDNKIAEIIFPIIEGMILTCIENKQHIILEGCYLPPDKIRELKEKFKNDIIDVFIGFSSKYINENFKNKIIANRCVIEERKYEETRTENEFSEEHQNLKKSCDENGIMYFEIQKDYEYEIKDIFQYIDERIHPRV